MGKSLVKKEDNNLNEVKQPKGCLKSFLVVLLIFVVVGGAVAKMVVDLMDNYNESKQEVELVIGYLNEPYNVNEIVTSAITQEHYDNFVAKALASNFTVFDNGAVSLTQDITLGGDIILTDNELGAFIGRALAANSVNYNSSLITLVQLDVVEGDADFTLKTVFRLNFESVQEDIALVVENFPTNIYITLEVQVLVANNELTIVEDTETLQFNQLEQSKNEKISSFINTLLNDNSSNVSFLNSLRFIVKDVLVLVTTKTESILTISDGGILISVNQE